jgi:hypothetical protein
MALLIDREEIHKSASAGSLLKLIFFHYSPPKLSYIKGF